MWNFNHTELINSYKINTVLKFITLSDGLGHKIEKKLWSVSSSNAVRKTKCFIFFRNQIVMLFQCLISSFLPRIWFSRKVNQLCDQTTAFYRPQSNFGFKFGNFQMRQMTSVKHRLKTGPNSHFSKCFFKPKSHH